MTSLVEAGIQSRARAGQPQHGGSVFLCSLTRGYLRVAAFGLPYSWVVAANFPDEVPT